MGKGEPQRAPAEQLGLVDSGETANDESGYRCIAADPPWQEKGGSRGADKHYPLLATADIPRVMMQSPMWRPAAHAHLWLWVTSNFLDDGLFVLRALGFRFVIGQYLRLRHELLLFGVRGRLHTQDHGVDSVVQAARTRHSEKPEEAYRRIERVSPGPRLEMFARSPRPGWDVWGNEVDAAAVDGAARGVA